MVTDAFRPRSHHVLKCLSKRIYAAGLASIVDAAARRVVISLQTFAATREAVDMSSSTGQRVRHALVGTGSGAEMFARALVRDHADTAELVAFADVNQARMDAHNRWLGELGHPP